MARLDRPEQKNANPAKHNLEWKSNEKAFEFYNKETKEKVEVQLPLKFLFLEHYHTVKGWNDAAVSGIWSNEVYSIANEDLDIKCKSGPIAKGLYKENKTKIKDAGGVYHRSIYVMNEAGEILNLQIKGACIGGLTKDAAVAKEEVEGYSDFYHTNSHLVDNQWIEINEVAEGKKGAVKYTIPVFKMGEVISKEADALANEAVKVLQDYMNGYFEVDDKLEAAKPEPANVDGIEADDLEF